jgi:hypothetical protein
MKYEKPSIVTLGPASHAIQGVGNKWRHIAPDADGSQLPFTTGSAYDLDE